MQFDIEEIFNSGAVKAVLLDHAGVLVNIEDIHAKARAQVFNSFGCNLTDTDGKSMMGFGEKKLFEYMKDGIRDPTTLGPHLRLLDEFKRVVAGCDDDWQEFRKIHDATYEALYSKIEDPLSLVTEGLAEFHMAAYERNIPEGIVSNSARAHVMADADLNVRRLNRIRLAHGMTPVTHEELFRVTITADDMKETGLPTKPSMAPYLLGAARMQGVRGLETICMSEILCIEDSSVGVASADAAGLLVVQRVYNTAVDAGASIRNAKVFGWVDEYGRLDRVELNPSHVIARQIMNGDFVNNAITL